MSQSNIKPRRAVFFDRDGVINKSVDLEGGRTRTPWTWDEFSFLPGVEECLAQLKAGGFLCILVSNQPDVALGKMSEGLWSAMQQKVEDLGFDDIYLCRHHISIEPCECKKPKPGMLLAAAKKWDISLADSFMVGDTESDLGAAKAAGVRSILLDWPYNQELKSDYRVKTLLEAVNIILK